ncbi:hypothetical protein HHK36_027995 [Tetracentron sinense]|uniref:Uncharacterized protein n=1 Tax=Tetracentron sinense TaxID=13715 RepID=A0A834YF06_TETSI|nr:hypothetical protein HHK36_027995 [Tetracentron sinense]
MAISLSQRADYLLEMLLPNTIYSRYAYTTSSYGALFAAYEEAWIWEEYINRYKMMTSSQSDLEANLFRHMKRRGYGEEYINRYTMMTRSVKHSWK